MSPAPCSTSTAAGPFGDAVSDHIDYLKRLLVRPSTATGARLVNTIWRPNVILDAVGFYPDELRQRLASFVKTPRLPPTTMKTA